MAFARALSFCVGLVTLPMLASPWQLEDTLRVQSAKEVAMAPNGKTIAYTASAPRQLDVESDGPAWSRLYVLDETGRSRTFVGGNANVRDLHWDHESERLWFLNYTAADKFFAVYAMPIGGGESIRVYHHDQHIQGFDISNDERYLLFWAKQTANNDSNVRVFEEDSIKQHLWLIDLGADTPKAVPLITERHVIQARFVPGEQQILVHSSPSSLADAIFTQNELATIDFSGEVQQRLPHPGKVGDFHLSPDGKHLAFIGAVSAADPSAGQLFVSDVANASTQLLLTDFAGHVQSLNWLGNDEVVFVAHQDTGAVLGSKDIDKANNKFRVLERNEKIYTQVSSDAKGRNLALIAHQPEHPPEVFWRTRNGMLRLTELNPWLQQKTLATQRVFRYQARDDLALEGILFLPPSYDKKQRYPTLLFIHGGPEDHLSHGWLERYSQPAQWAAAQGFVSFFPNYRGSTGRGVAFTQLGFGDLAGAEFNDIIDAKRALVSAGISAPEKFAISGASYGGYAAAWGATAQSEEFAASVMFIGISNQLSKFGTTDIAQELFNTHTGKWPWQQWSFLLKRSPISYVQQHRTPLLILHGERDERVHPGQSLELYRHLKALDQAPVRLVLYANEGHGIVNGAARRDYAQRLMQWMRHFVLEDGKTLPPKAF